MGDPEKIRIELIHPTLGKTREANIPGDMLIADVIPEIVRSWSLADKPQEGRYVLSNKESGTELREDQTLNDAGVREGDHIRILFQMIPAGRDHV